MTRGKRPLCQTREMHVEGTEGAIFGSSDGRREGRKAK